MRSLEEITDYVMHSPETIRAVRAQFQRAGVDDRVMTDGHVAEAVKFAYIQDPALARFLLPDEAVAPQASGKSKGGGGFLSDFFTGVGNIATTTLGSVAGIVGSLGTNAQANAANSAATAEYNKQQAALAQQQAAATAKEQAAKDESTKRILIFGGVGLLVAIIIVVIVKTTRG